MNQQAQFEKPTADDVVVGDRTEQVVTKVDVAKDDTNRVDVTKLEHTKHDVSEVDDVTKDDTNRVDVTKIDHTKYDATKVDDVTKVDVAKDDTNRVDVAKLDHTKHDVTKVDDVTSDDLKDGDIYYWVDRSGHTLKGKLWRGRRMGGFMHLVTNYNNRHKLKVRDDDMVLAAFPSSGSHWLYEVIHMLYRGKPDYIEGKKDELFLEQTPVEEIEACPSPRVINSHMGPEDIAPGLTNGRCKIIFLCRNPKDVFVSHYRHLASTRDLHPAYQGTFRDYFELSLGSETQKYKLRSWVDYINKWEAYFREHPHLKILYMFYEDMKEDLPRETRRVADFLSLNASDDLVKKISDACTIEKMKAGKSTLDPTDTHVYRAGQSGTWKQHFTVDMNERYDRILSQSMRGSYIMERIRYTL